jgi:hypothetical protein
MSAQEPGTGGTQGFCLFCEKVDFSNLFNGVPNTQVELGLWEDIEKRKQRCSLCRFIHFSLQSMDDFDSAIDDNVKVGLILE